MDEKLDHFFNNFKSAAKVNLVLEFILNQMENGAFRYFCAHEKITLLDRSKLVYNTDDLASLREILKKTDVIEYCSRTKMNTKCGSAS